MSITDEQLVAMLDAFGHAWHRWEQSDSNAEMWERGRARDEERRAIVDAYAELRTELADANTMIGSLGSQLAAVKAERDKLRGIAQALRITVAEMLSGKQHTPARTMVWRSTLKYAAEALSADAPSEPEPRRQCDSLLRDPEQPLTLWRCVADAGHGGVHWSRDRAHEWTDARAYDINTAEPTAAANASPT